MISRRIVLLGWIGGVLAMSALAPASAAPPLPPSALTATATSTTGVHLAWTDNSDNEAAFVVQSSLYPDRRFTRLARLPANQTQLDAVALTPDTTYYFRIRAVRSNGRKSTFSNMGSARTFAIISSILSPPDIVTATPATCSQVDLSWSPSTQTGTGLAAYRVYRDGLPLATTAATVFSDTGRAASESHVYTITAIDTTGHQSAASGGASAATPACTVNIPPMAKARSGASLCAPGMGVAFEGSESFDLDGALVSLAWDFGDGATGTGASTSHVYAAAGTYGVTLTVTDDRGAQGSDHLSIAVAPPAGPAPDPPSQFAASASSPNQVDLRWTAPPQGDAIARIERADSAAGPWSEIAQIDASAGGYSDQWLASSTAYFYRASAYNAAGTSAYSPSALATTPYSGGVPNPPRGFTTIAVSANEIDFIWSDNSTNEAGFKIERAASSEGPWVLATTVAADAGGCSSTFLSSASTYFFRARSYNASGESVASNPSASTTQQGLAIPEAPTALTASVVTSSRIDLSWTDSSDNETGFAIERADSDAGPFTQVGTSDAPSWSDTGLASAHTYLYRVRAFNGEGASAYTAIAAATTPESIPDAPAGLSATAISSGEIDLTWSDQSSNESGFRIERALSGSGPFTEIATSAAASFADTTVSGGTAYYYRVSAYNGAGRSDYSNTATATTPQIPVPPEAPGSLSASASSSSRIDLFWIDRSDNETGFAIDSAPSSSGPWTSLVTLGANAASYAHTGLPAATTVYYRVRAFNAAGSSGYTNIAGATTPQVAPAAPANLTATAISPSQINLSWSDQSSNESGFRIERAPAGSGPFTEIATSAAASFADTTVNGGTAYYYRVSAYNGAGRSGYSNTATATTPQVPMPPDAPGSLTATAVSSSRIDLSWSDLSDNETGFAIETAPASTGPWSALATLGANATSFSHTGLSPATTAYYRVRAHNGAGSSGYSNTAGATTPDTAPDAPSGLTAAAVSPSQINLSWTDQSSNESGFRIERALFGSGPFAEIATSATAAFADTTVSGGTTYFYRVSAYNGVGRSGYSNTATASTPQVPVPPDAPGSLTATAASSSRIDLAWADLSDNETGFAIETAPASTGPWSALATSGANATSFAHTGLAPATTVYYRVRAFNATGSSGYTNIAGATTSDAAPAAPSGLTAAAVSASQINLIWTDQSSNESGFRIERAASAAGPFSEIATRAANSTSYSDTGLTASTSYSYRVRAWNAAGTSAYANTATATTSSGSADTTPPSAPSGLAVTAPSCGRLALSWNASTDSGGSGLRGYNIYRKNVLIQQVDAPATQVVDSGLGSGLYFYYSVAAVDQAGNQSAKSSMAGSYTQACAGSGGDYRWARGFGGLDVYDSGYALAVDRDGSVFVTGEFQETADFGFGPRTSNGYRDIFVAKYSAAGDPIWLKTFGGPYDDSGKGIGLDANGDVLLTAAFLNSMTVSGKTLVSDGSYDIALIKLSGADGSRIWAKRIGGAGDDRAEGLAVDSHGNVAIAGQFKGTVDFGDGPVTCTSPYAQAFLASFAGADGALIWVRRFGELLDPAHTTFGAAQAVAVDGGDNLVVTGFFRGPANFGGGALPTAGGLDVFVGKYTSSGAHVWSKSFGDAQDQHGMGVAVDSSGNIIVTGDFLGHIDFGAGALASTNNAQTMFLASLDAGGHHRWSKGFAAQGLTSGSFAYDVDVDGSDNVLLTGTLAGPVDFGGGPLPLAGSIFLAKFASNGTHLWSKSFTGSGGKGRSVAASPDGSLVLTGSFEVNVDFGAGDIRTNGGTVTDAFLARVGP